MTAVSGCGRCRQLPSKGSRSNGLGGMNGHLSLKGNFIPTKWLVRGGNRSVDILIPSPASASSITAFTCAATAATFLLVRLSDVESGNINEAGISTSSSLRVLTDSVRLQIHFRLEHHKLLLHALSVVANVMVLFKVLFQCVVIQIVVRMP